jgi:hypothetical protein
MTRKKKLHAYNIEQKEASQIDQNPALARITEKTRGPFIVQNMLFGSYDKMANLGFSFLDSKIQIINS